MTKENPKTDDYSVSFQDNYVERISSAYHHLGQAEQRAAKYILEHRGGCAQLSIKEFASCCGASTASIIRLCKDLGYAGFAELKFQMRQDIQNFASDNLKITSHDSIATLKQKTLQFAQYSLDATVQGINDNELDHAATALSRAKRVLFCGMGSACGAALAGVNHLLSAGIDATFLMDDLLQMRAAARLTKGDVIIGINYDGYSKSVADALMIAKKKEVTTIVITSIENSLVTKYADIVLYTLKRNANNSLNYSTTTICQLIIVHLLIVCVWQKMGASLDERSSEVRTYTSLKRYTNSTREIQVKENKQ